MLLAELFEARRNPDLNPRQTTLSALEEFKNDPTVFISFTEDVGISSHGALWSGTTALSGHKIGVNPKTRYSSTTPAGIYCYPVAAMWPQIQKNHIPFGKERPFIYVLRSTKPMLDLATYTQADFDRDVTKLLALRPSVAMPEETIDVAQRVAPVKTPGGRIWNVTRELAKELTFAKGKPLNLSIWVWNRLFRQIGYGGVSDTGAESIIHYNEPCQAVFFSRDAFAVLDVIHNKWRKPRRVLLSAHPMMVFNLPDPTDDDWNEAVSALLSGNYGMSKNIAPFVHNLLRRSYDLPTAARTRLSTLGPKFREPLVQAGYDLA